MPPRALLSAERLDIAVKWRLFAIGDADAERVYRWHIEKRTGGVEPGSWKKSIDDYMDAAFALTKAMRVRGFDPATPVVMGSNGRLRAGAHRLSCALALELPALAVRIDARRGTAAPWGRDWFVRHGISAADLRRIEADLELLTQ